MPSATYSDPTLLAREPRIGISEMQASLIYVTASDAAEARAIARHLLEDRLIACANINAQLQSLYRWNDAIQEEPEAAFVAKTRSELVPDVIERVRELHSYSCPCVVAFPIQDANPDYLDWITAQTRPVTETGT